MPVAGHHLGRAHAVPPPAGDAAHVVVEQQGLQAVEGGGVAGLRSLARLELLPQPPQGVALAGGQQAEDALRRGALPLLLAGVGGLVVGEGVAGVDLHEVVDQVHAQHLAQVDLRGGMLTQDQRHQRQVPGVLGVVLPAVVVGQPRPPEDLL